MAILAVLLKNEEFIKIIWYSCSVHYVYICLKHITWTIFSSADEHKAIFKLENLTTLDTIKLFRSIADEHEAKTKIKRR